MPIEWERMKVEFHHMKEFDQLRAVTKEQMNWLTYVAEQFRSNMRLTWDLAAAFPRSQWCEAVVVSLASTTRRGMSHGASKPSSVTKECVVGHQR